MATLKRRLLKIKFLITGDKLIFLPEILHVKGVSIYYFKLKSESTAEVIIDSQDFIKFFAICKNMCYNKKIIGYYGILAPLTLLLNKVGLVIGSILFIVLVLIFNNFLLDIKVVGSGACFEEQTKSVIYNYGIKKFTPFSSISYDEVENLILSSNPRIAFVSAKKQGNILVIESVLSKAPIVLGENKNSLVSNANGVVEEITVLRGTPLVEEGSLVEVGDELVGGYYTLKNQERVPTFVLARVKIISEEEYFYKSDNVSDIEISIAYALAKFTFQGEIISLSHKVEDEGVRVFVKIRHVINGG
jgi:hypothetical protein